MTWPNLSLNVDAESARRLLALSVMRLKKMPLDRRLG
jgi:hypothetical protein